MNVENIQFKTVEIKTLLTSGQVCYQGRLAHNRTLTPEATREAFATFANVKASEANRTIDSVCEFIADELAKGHRLDFGAFSVSLAMHGGFPSRNAAFDPKRNEIRVTMMPGSSLKKAVKKLRPVNALSEDEKAQLAHTEQVSPRRGDMDALDPTGVRRMVTCGVGRVPEPTGENAGIWLENDAGTRLLTATEISFDGAIYSYTMSGAVETGLYWLVIAGRSSVTGEYVRLARRIAVKASRASEAKASRRTRQHEDE